MELMVPADTPVLAWIFPPDMPELRREII